MKSLIPVFLMFISLFALSRCYYDNEESLYPQLPGGCDTTTVTYTATIAPIMSSYCTGCHGAGASGGYDLRTYDLVKTNIVRIYGAMKHDSGFKPMPQGGSQLDDCTILKIQVWENRNMPQ